MGLSEEARNRQNEIRVLGLMLTGVGSCPGCHRQREIFSRRRTTPSQGEERCLDCWRAER